MANIYHLEADTSGFYFFTKSGGFRPVALGKFNLPEDLEEVDRVLQNNSISLYFVISWIMNYMIEELLKMFRIKFMHAYSENGYAYKYIEIEGMSSPELLQLVGILEQFHVSTRLIRMDEGMKPSKYSDGKEFETLREWFDYTTQALGGEG